MLKEPPLDVERVSGTIEDANEVLSRLGSRKLLNQGETYDMGYTLMLFTYNLVNKIEQLEDQINYLSKRGQPIC